MIGDIMEEYLLFADETKPTKSNPNFCLSGVSVSRQYYENTLMQQINQLKKKHFGKTDIIFHFADMKKNRNEFAIFQDKNKRESFWNEFIEIIKVSNIDIIGIYFNNDKVFINFNYNYNKFIFFYYFKS